MSGDGKVDEAAALPPADPGDELAERRTKSQPKGEAKGLSAVDEIRAFALELVSAWEVRFSALEARVRDLERANEFSGWVSRQKAAAITGFSKVTIDRLIRKGRLRAGGLRRDRIRRSDLGRLLAETGLRKKGQV